MERTMVAAARPKLRIGHKMEMGRSARRTEYYPAIDPAGAHGAETKEANIRGAMEGLWVKPAMGRDMAAEIAIRDPEGELLAHDPVAVIDEIARAARVAAQVQRELPRVARWWARRRDRDLDSESQRVEL